MDHIKATTKKDPECQEETKEQCPAIFEEIAEASFARRWVGVAINMNTKNVFIEGLSPGSRGNYGDLKSIGDKRVGFLAYTKITWIRVVFQ